MLEVFGADVPDETRSVAPCPWAGPRGAYMTFGAAAPLWTMLKGASQLLCVVCRFEAVQLCTVGLCVRYLVEAQLCRTFGRPKTGGGLPERKRAKLLKKSNNFTT